MTKSKETVLDAPSLTDPLLVAMAEAAEKADEERKALVAFASGEGRDPEVRDTEHVDLDKRNIEGSKFRATAKKLDDRKVKVERNKSRSQAKPEKRKDVNSPESL